MATLGKANQARIPPLPPFTVLVDREDGTEWVLAWADDEGVLRMTLNDQGLLRDPLPPRTDITRKDYFDLGGGVRVFVRGGRLGAELVQYEAIDGPLYTRVGVRRTVYRVVRPQGWLPTTEADGSPREELGMVQENALD